MADPVDASVWLENYLKTHPVGASSSTEEPMVKRWASTTVSTPGPGGAWGSGATYKSGGTTKVPTSQYVQEFYDKWDDPKFQTWLMSRAVASGQVSGTKGTFEDYLNNTWIAAAKAIANGYWDGTPEQYIEWAASGHTVSSEDIQKAIENGEPVLDENGDPIIPGVGPNAPANPITHYRSTSSATITRDVAYAMADELSQKLLGRMATKAEMRKARGVMNKMLKANPTVTTSTNDASDPNNVVNTSHTSQGMSASDAEAALQMKIQRSSEGTAYTVGSMFEDAMRLMAQKEG